MYTSALISAGANLPGNAFAWLFVDRIGRRFVLISSVFIAGGSVFGVLEVKSVTGVVVFSALISGISAGMWNALDILSVESFPTKQRATAFGIQAAVGRLGAISGNVVFAEVRRRFKPESPGGSLHFQDEPSTCCAVGSPLVFYRHPRGSSRTATPRCRWFSRAAA